MQEFRIKRTNQEDLIFTGELLASVDDHGRAGDSVVGLQLSLYHTRLKVYILAITVHDYRSSRPKILYGAVSFPTIENIHDFLLSKEGRGISDLVHLLLEKVAETEKTTLEGGQKIIPDLNGRADRYVRQPRQL